MRILGITIPNNKHLDIAMTCLYGIGISRSRKILEQAGVDKNIKSDDLTVDQENTIRKIIESMMIGGSLKREIAANIKRIKDIKSYRGIRHIRRLPVNGQRTKTNSRTIRGNIRRTMASGKRKAEKT